MNQTPQNIRAELDQLLADRHSPEARALFTTLARYIHKRVNLVACRRYNDIFSEAEREEVVGEVLLTLMKGALGRFRGHSIGELTAYVRCICDRQVGHTARRRIKERDALLGDAGEAVRTWTAAAAPPDQLAQGLPDSPLAPKDADYLLALFAAGSQADYARAQGVSRAAVTQRIQRIKTRIDKLSPDDQITAEVWVRRTAERAACLREG